MSGEVAVFLDALGSRKDNSKILDAIVLVGPRMETAEFDTEGERSVYYLFKPAGTELLFEDDVLVSVMVRTQPDADDDEFDVYPRPAALVDGLSATADRAAVTAFLGTPERAGEGFDRYRVNGRYLHFEFDPRGHVAKISALLEAI
ncbi:hypothetical protein [Umezawaea sp. Da 62-37]|uniref:hypothetical protein n=1 Tax=Umezawaea sp. Da 62-37 TaxID=3075927 RepID=UPI0028F712D2|nr:hypothetical protein [Umezawaea sp. Da 62-37]WNV87852.1 hypothetical protein RM788_06090 [Umezawaea sp. Da 62-37]